MNQYYQADGWTKFSEEDIYQEGCQPNTGGMFSGRDTWRADSVEDLIQQLLNFTGGEREGVELDSCDDIGRVDISLMEDENGSIATRQQINDWKEAKIRLWGCIYTFQVESITSEPVPLMGAL